MKQKKQQQSAAQTDKAGISRYTCDTCNDQGVLSLDVPHNHPDYYRRIPCSHCEKGQQRQEKIHQNRLKKTGVPAAYQDCTFESFTQLEEKYQQGKLLVFGSSCLFAENNDKPFTLREASKIVNADRTFPKDTPRSWLVITDDRVSILEEVVRYRDGHQQPTLFTTNWDLPTFLDRWGMQIGDIVAKAHWIKIGGLKLRKTVEGAVESF
jgi:hypothetical protein